MLAQKAGTTDWLQSVVRNVGPISLLDFDNVRKLPVDLHPATLEFKLGENTLFNIEELATGNGSYDMLITVVGANHFFIPSDLTNGEWTKSRADFACDRVSVNGQDCCTLNQAEYTVRIVFQG